MVALTVKWGEKMQYKADAMGQKGEGTAEYSVGQPSLVCAVELLTEGRHKNIKKLAS